MNKWSEDIIPNKPTIQYQEFECCRCGNKNRFIKPEWFIDWKKEHDIRKKMFHDLLHELNELMAFSELHYNLNPHKEKLVKALLKIREKFERED